MKKYLCIAFLSAFVLSSCVHQWPEAQDAPVVLKLNYDTELPIYKVVDWISKASSDPEDYDVRYIIKAFPERRSGQFYTSPSKTWVFTQEDVSSLNYEVRIEIPEGVYRFMVWTDFVPAGTDAHFFHNPDDFAEIRENTSLIGNNDMRDCYRGWADLDVVRFGTQVPPVSGVVEMSRSIAKFSVEATDLADFLTKAAKTKSESLKTKVDPSEIDLDEYKIVFYYTGFKPNAYNMHNDRPCDSNVGYKFESKIQVTENNKAFLGFDYCFANSTETTVNLAIGVVDKDGTEVSLVKGIDVPLQRGKHTIMRGRFMTQESYGGVAINPDFDGEFNITI